MPAEQVVSPLTGTSNVELLRSWDTAALKSQWRERLGIDISSELEGETTIRLYLCLDTQLQFFHPPALAGSENLYRELQKIDWYYAPEKWEFRCAERDLKDKNTIVEIGCGPGKFLATMSSKHGATVVGLELNASAAAAARGIGLQVIQRSTEEFSESNGGAFDAVCAFQVLEHVSDPKRFIEACVRMLKPGGQLIFCVPNAKGFLEHADEILDMPPHHMTRWSEASLRSLQSLFPLQIERVRYQPLEAYEIPLFVTAARRRWSAQGGWRNSLTWDRLGSRLLPGFLALGFRRLCRGHSIYALYRKSSLANGESPMVHS